MVHVYPPLKQASNGPQSQGSQDQGTSSVTVTSERVPLARFGLFGRAKQWPEKPL